MKTKTVYVTEGGRPCSSEKECAYMEAQENFAAYYDKYFKKMDMHREDISSCDVADMIANNPASILHLVHQIKMAADAYHIELHGRDADTLEREQLGKQYDFAHGIGKPGYLDDISGAYKHDTMASKSIAPLDTTSLSDDSNTDFDGNRMSQDDYNDEPF